jgi:hypothetical protein
MVKRGCISLAAVLLLSVTGYAQKPSLDATQADGSVRVIVVVTDKSGSPVTDLGYEDFRLFDNDAVRPIKSFRVIGAAQSASARPFVRVSGSKDDGARVLPRYEIVFEAAVGGRSNEYHRIAVQVKRAGLQILLTRDGYFAR